MNKIFKVIWNAKKGCNVVTSETAKGTCRFQGTARLAAAAVLGLTVVAGGVNMVSAAFWDASWNVQNVGGTVNSVHEDDNVKFIAGSDKVTATVTRVNAGNTTISYDLSQGTKDSLDKAYSALQNVETQIDGTHVKTITKDNNVANFISGDNITLTEEGGAIKVSTNANVVTKDTDRYVTGGTATYEEDGTGTATLTGTNSVKATVTGLKDTKVTEGSVTGDTITLTNNDGSNVAIDAGDLKDGVTTVASSDESVSVTDADTGKNHVYDVKVNYGKVAENTQLSYKDNGGTKKQVSLGNGLNFVNTDNIRMATGDNGQVTATLNPELKNVSSISNGDTTGSKITLGGNGDKNISVNGGKITNVAPGTAANDVATVGQVQEAKNGINGALRGLDSKINTTGANAAALAGLKPIQYDPLEPTQIMAAYGHYHNKSAVAVGVAHFTNESTMFHAGVTLDDQDNMFNVGVTKKLGSSAAKKAIPERYQGGPISSVYVMNDEITALKEENARIKQENEDTKDKLAMVMAKLGL